jgi:hypothetical protein
MSPEDDPKVQAWLDAMAEDIARLTPEDLAAIDEREKRIEREIEQIEAGTHPLCRQPAA